MENSLQSAKKLFEMERRTELQTELNQLIGDVAVLVASDQAKVEEDDEAAPLVVPPSEDSVASPANNLYCFNFSNPKTFVANAGTIGTTFRLDKSIETNNVKRFIGMCMDTLGMAHAVSQGAKEIHVTSRRFDKEFIPQLTPLMSCATATVQGFMEQILLPRNLQNTEHDSLLRLWFTSIRNPLHVTENCNCQPMKLMFLARQCLQKLLHKNDVLNFGAHELLTTEDFLRTWSSFHSNFPNDTNIVMSADPKTNLGLAHIEVFGNPKSKYFSTVTDSPDLLRSLPDNEDKELVCQMRRHILDLANNVDSYIQKDDKHGDVFRPVNPSNFYKLPDKVFNLGTTLPSQIFGDVKTPRALENQLPQHLRVCDSYISLHQRPAHSYHYKNLLKLYPLKVETVSDGDKHSKNLHLQPEIVTPQGYWIVWLPSTLPRRNIEMQGGAGEKAYFFDLMHSTDEFISVVRYDRKRPQNVRSSNQSRVGATSSDNALLHDDRDDGLESEEEMQIDLSGNEDDEIDDLTHAINFLEDEEESERALQERYNEFLLSVHRWVNGLTESITDKTTIPVFMTEINKNGKEVPYKSMKELSSSTEQSALAANRTKGVKIYMPFMDDWVHAHKKCYDDIEHPILKAEAREEANKRTVKAMKCMKKALARSRFMTNPVCITRVACAEEVDRDGNPIMEPIYDESGTVLLDEYGNAKMEKVFREIPVRLGMHYSRPFPKNEEYKLSMKKLREYCDEVENRGDKPLPVLHENFPKYKQFLESFVDGNFNLQTETSLKSKTWWEVSRHITHTSNKRQVIENGIIQDIRGRSEGPDFTRAQRSTTQAALIQNLLSFKNGEMGLAYIQRLGKEVWVKMVAKDPSPEYYISTATQPWFESTFQLDVNNCYTLKPEVKFPDIHRVDPDHAFEDVIEVYLHTIFDHIGSVFNQYKYCHLVYATFGTAFRKPESYELAEMSNSTAASVKFVGGTATGKTKKCQEVLRCFNKERHLSDEQGNSALYGLGVEWDNRECAMSYSDETNEDKDKEQLRQEKLMHTLGFISRGRSSEYIGAHGEKRYLPTKTSNRTNSARVACVNEEAQGGENVKANEDRCLKIYAEESKVSYLRAKYLHGAEKKTLKSAILEEQFRSADVHDDGMRVLSCVREHTERIGALETFITTLPTSARDVDMRVANKRWKDINEYMKNKGVVTNDRPRLNDTMSMLARFKVVEMATLAAFEAYRREDGSKIPFTPENFWRIVPYMYCTERIACKVFHYCASESLGVNYHFPIMDSLLTALLMHRHIDNDEENVRKRYMESEKHDPRRLVFVYKMQTRESSVVQKYNELPRKLRVAWGNLAQKTHGINKAKHNFVSDWGRLKKCQSTLADWRVRDQGTYATEKIDSLIDVSEHKIYHFPGITDARQRGFLPIIEEVDQNIEIYDDQEHLDTITCEIVKGTPATSELDQDYSRENYYVITVAVAALRYTIEQRHSRSENGDMKDADVIDVVREYDKVPPSLLKEALVHVCSYKNNMKDPCQKIINDMRAKANKKSAAHTGDADEFKNYYREQTPGLRYKKCRYANKDIPKNYRVMTLAEPPSYYGGQVLLPAICSTLVITENPKNVQTFGVNMLETTETAAALGTEYYDTKNKARQKRQKEKNLYWNIDIRAHYEKYLQLCHPKTGFLRGTEWAYDIDFTESEKRKHFISNYCKEFPPYSVLVHGLPLSKDAGHTPQQSLYQYIDESRRARRKRPHPTSSQPNMALEDDDDQDDFSNMFEDEPDKGDEQDEDGYNEEQNTGASSNSANVANVQEGNNESAADIDKMMSDALDGVAGYSQSSEEMEIDESLDEDNLRAGESAKASKRRKVAHVTLKDLMEHVTSLDKQVEDKFKPHHEGDPNLVIQRTFHEDNDLDDSNPLLDLESALASNRVQHSSDEDSEMEMELE